MSRSKRCFQHDSNLCVTLEPHLHRPWLITEVNDSNNISKVERPKTTLANAGQKRLSEESIGQPEY